jgi:integrase
MKPNPGITRRHSARCATRQGRGCDCQAGWQAQAYDPVAGKCVRKTLATLDQARDWQARARIGVRQGTVRARDPITIREAADELIAGLEAGTVRNRSGDPYKPSVIAGYRSLLEREILPAFGAMRLDQLQRRHVQRFADSLLADGKSPSTVRNTLMPLRVLYRRAIRDDLASLNPCERIELPAMRPRKVTIVSADQAATLLAAIPALRDRALWAAAIYAGLRRGELMALQWQDVDLAAGQIHVERAYCPRSHETVGPKSRAGTRRVPVAGALRDHLLEHRMQVADPAPDALVFGDDAETPFDYKPALDRARQAWQAAKLEPLGLHAARHTAASLMIAAGVNVKALSTFMGHASITTTLDRYGHLLPGGIDEAAALLDAYLAGVQAGRDREQATTEAHEGR